MKCSHELLLEARFNAPLLRTCEEFGYRWIHLNPIRVVCLLMFTPVVKPGERTGEYNLIQY